MANRQSATFARSADIPLAIFDDDGTHTRVIRIGSSEG